MSEEENETKVHNLLAENESPADGVELIVRKGNKYGPALAGERVLVHKSELMNRSTMEACITEEDHQKYLRDKAAREADLKKREASTKGVVAQAVDAALDRIAKSRAEKRKRQEERDKQAPPATPVPQPTKNTLKGTSAYEGEEDGDK